MGLSRNKVAVSEGAAGSPPFYGEPVVSNRILRNSKVESLTKDDEIRVQRRLLFNFQGLSNLWSLKTIEHTPYGGVAQLGEHLPCKQGVMGSNPIISTNLPNGKLCRF